MSATVPAPYTFSRGLYLDRKRGKYTFLENAETVLVVNPHEPVSREDLEALYHPYQPGELADWREMVDAPVLADMRRQDRARAVAGESALEKATAERASAVFPDRADSAAAVARPFSGDKGLAILGDPALPPADRVLNLKRECRALLNEWLEGAGGAESILQGHHDREIREVVIDLCREIKPRQLLRGPRDGSAAHAGASEGAEGGQPMEKALTSQAFGNRLELSEVELFLLAKSAIVQSLSRTGYRNIVDIKGHLLLRGASRSLERKLCMYYEGVERYLAARRVAPEIIELVADSKFIYLHREVRSIDGRALALGVADAFTTLKEASRLTVEILEVLVAQLRSCLPGELSEVVETTEKLLRDACYNEYRRPVDRSLAGGDHCDFLSLGPSRRGLLVFDVSGHDHRASEVRDLLVEVLGRVAGEGDPGTVLTLLNRFCLKYPLPQDLFVSMVFAVLDVSENLLSYANAGHHPPYLVRGDQIFALDDAGDMALNIADGSYSTRKIRLEPCDCLVLYTDGLIEAVNRAGRLDLRQAEAGDRFFGKDRLQQTILRRQLYHRRASEAVDLILAAAHDEGFVIEDDVTVQVYRHV